MIQVQQLKLPVGHKDTALLEALIAKLHVKKDDILSFEVAKRSLDARKKPELFYSYVVNVQVKNQAAVLKKKPKNTIPFEKKIYQLPTPLKEAPSLRPVIIGTGPAGLFAGLVLARLGCRPILLERGDSVEERQKKVDIFWNTGILDLESNVQFGEGGAGTFSDGKLTTRIGDELCGFVTEVFLQHGAPEEIAWKQKPHVGTDLLRGVITSIRREIEALGGEVHFNTALTGFEQKNGRLTGIFTTGGTFPCEALVFAVGHSARDTFGMLMDSGLVLECKPFSVGFRAEHLQSEIEKSLYHEAAGHPALPRGEYQLSQHVGDRCVYTFCMCPGGQVVASASETGHVVTNGMSYHARDGKNANAAVVVSVGAEDFAGDPRRAIAFQRELEAKAYAAGCRGGAYAAPAENVQSFLEGKGQLNIGRVEPTYDRGVVAADLGALLPGELADTLRAIVPIPVELWDERQTTVSAANILSENGTYGKKRKDVLDAVAATVILESYMAYRRNTGKS